MNDTPPPSFETTGTNSQSPLNSRRERLYIAFSRCNPNRPGLYLITVVI